MSLISKVLDRYTSTGPDKIIWYRGWSEYGEQPRHCIMGAIGLVLQTNLSTLDIAERLRCNEQERREFYAFYQTLQDQYPDWEGNVDQVSHTPVQDLISAVTGWNDVVCKDEEEFLRVLEKTAIRIAEDVS